MKYSEALTKSMEMLAEDERTLFLGYNINYGSQAYGTLSTIPKEKKIETPVAENLMMGLATGLAIEGYKPVVFFERHDFMLNALDSIINHLDKIKTMCCGDYSAPVIIRAVIGSKEPLHPGPQHIQDFTEAFKSMINFPILTPETPLEVLGAYKFAKELNGPVMIIEKKELYNKEQEFQKYLVESEKSIHSEFQNIKKNNEKVLVTGGAGYVGCVLVPKLVEKGYDVRVLDLMLFGSKGLDSVKDKIEIISGNIKDENILRRSLEGIDYVIHLAAISNDPCSELDPELTKQVNFEATKKLVEISKQKGIKRFIYASSSSVYGIKDEPNVTEELSLNPLTIYSKTKAQSEEVVKSSNDQNFTTVNIRPATICGYSPRLRLDLTVNILTDHAINKGKITVFGGDQKRPNIHIEDITDYYIDLLNQPKDKIAGKTFNAGYENYTVNEIADMVKNVIGDHIDIIRTPSNDNRSYHISSKKISNELGLNPKKTIRDAVIDLKNAFEYGLISDPSDPNYKNIEKMKKQGY